ncbi:MAG: SDR family NAD(P)-dependent oxidoreductase, partial [Alphaproteobacteria bacterium]
MKRFEDKIAFVSGAANGIGKACMQRLAAEGATVIAADWKSDDLEAAIKPLLEAGYHVTGIPTDVMEESQIEAAFARVDGFGGGGLDISLH